MGVVETEKAFRAEVSKVCRFYCLQMQNEALNQAGVEDSSALKRVESVYYPLAIHASGSKANSISKEVDKSKESPTKTLPTANISPAVAKQSKDAERQ